jgi:hypothetical protein
MIPPETSEQFPIKINCVIMHLVGYILERFDSLSNFVRHHLYRVLLLCPTTAEMVAIRILRLSFETLKRLLRHSIVILHICTVLPTVAKLILSTRIAGMHLFLTYATGLSHFRVRETPVKLGVSACIRSLITD